MKNNIRIIYSKRKTLAIQIKKDEVVVRAPYGCPESEILSFVESHREWIKKHLWLQKEKAALISEYQDEGVLKTEALAYFTNETERISKIMGIKYSRIRITGNKRRLGSCTSDGVLSFSYHLMRFPSEVRQYVIVHELAHRIEMNHSGKFYEIVERYIPDYKRIKRLLVNF